MTDCHFLVNDFNIDRNRLRLDAAIVSRNAPCNPKVRVIFRCGQEIRRLPMPMKAIFRRGEDTIAVFAYTYLINRLFLTKPDDEISISFEADFGDESLEALPFQISSGVAVKSRAEIDPRYIGGAVFDGVAVYATPAEEEADEVEEDPNTDAVYTCAADPAARRLVLRCVWRRPPQSAPARALSAAARGLLTVFALLGIPFLLPLYLLDALLAVCGVTPRRQHPPQPDGLRDFIGQFKTNIAAYLKYALKNQPAANRLIAFREEHYLRRYRRLCKKPVVENRIAFISGRRDELGGNEKFVYDLLKDRKDLDFRFLMITDLDKFSEGRDKKKFYDLYATSKVVIVDDYYSLLNSVEKRPEVTLFQLWHACGAFKTFGFTRLGKEGGPKQTAVNHRMYDYTIVSSESIVKYYAEGFGISDSHVLPTGIPRTDVFADPDYKAQTQAAFYEKYPGLRNKKIVLFAPTFRGAGQKSAYYPTSVFDPNRLIASLGPDYALILKLHPFCAERFPIDPVYADRILDLSEEDELNDLLFVTDLLITDYSSAVFEASLLGIPMLFYAYDLYQYISERDFYCDYETFVPGKIVFTQNELTAAILAGDYEQEKIAPFRKKYFSSLDGNASGRVADAILAALGKANEA